MSILSYAANNGGMQNHLNNIAAQGAAINTANYGSANPSFASIYPDAAAAGYTGMTVSGVPVIGGSGGSGGSHTSNANNPYAPTSSPTGGTGGTGTTSSSSKSEWWNPFATPLNNANAAATSMANQWSALLPGTSQAFSELISPETTGIESAILNTSAEQGMNQLASRYGDIPGHSGMSEEYGNYMGQVAQNLAQQRTENILPAMQMASQGYTSSSQIPLTNAATVGQLSQSYQMSPYSALLGTYQGIPYNSPTYAVT